MAFCKGCGAKIEWWKTKAGKNMPIDSGDPHPEGTVRIDVVANVAEVVPAGSFAPLYRSHFATCPRARSFRRPRPASGVE